MVELRIPSEDHLDEWLDEPRDLIVLDHVSEIDQRCIGSLHICIHPEGQRITAHARF